MSLQKYSCTRRKVIYVSYGHSKFVVSTLVDRDYQPVNKDYVATIFFNMYGTHFLDNTKKEVYTEEIIEKVQLLQVHIKFL